MAPIKGAKAVCCLSIFLSSTVHVASPCTSVIVGKGATKDGSTMTTHNADCLDCDFRLGKVPAADYEEGAMRRVYKFRAQFPRVVDASRGSTWAPENLDPWLPQRGDWLSDEFRDDMILGSIPQVSHTYSSIEGLYGIINEKQVAIGESTCGAPFFAGPKNEDCPVCNAMFDISELSRIAMERASSAREAIQIMGGLAEEHGFYGSEWDTSFAVYVEAGESLQVTDPEEAWVFHILPDDTSGSAVWAAQRVPEGHFAVVANQFIIGEVPTEPTDDFMFSSNLWSVAERNAFWAKEDGPLHFSRVYARRPYDYPHYAYSTRRMWRTFDLLAPSLNLPAYTDTFASDYPFSAAPDTLLEPQDIIRVIRDHYEGTAFDLTKGLAAGPYGDPDRYDASASLDGSLTSDEAYFHGYFQRSISLFRTSYCFVTQSRSFLPAAVGGVAWYAQYKPSVSTFVPVYVGVDDIPKPLTIGSLFTYTKEANWWAYSSVGNWMAKYRMYIHPEVSALQKKLEGSIFSSRQDVEQQAAALIEAGDDEQASALLTSLTNSTVYAARDSYNTMFETFISMFHDGYRMTTPTASIVTMTRLFYPKSWLQAVGYFDSLQEDAAGVKAVREAQGGGGGGGGGEDEAEVVAAANESEDIEKDNTGSVGMAPEATNDQDSYSWPEGIGSMPMHVVMLASLATCAIVFTTLGAWMGSCCRPRGYSSV